MIRLTGLNNSEIEEISRHVADAFWDYEYSNGDLGLKKFIANPRSYVYIYQCYC